MCTFYNLPNSFIYKLSKEIELNFLINKKNPKYKARYQEYSWCYQKYMVEGLNHEQMAEEAGCTKRTIEKWCTERHRLTQKYRQSETRLSRKQSDLIIGSLLGDGHIDKRENQPVFIVSHANNQKDYLYWKYEILKPLCNIPPSSVDDIEFYDKSLDKTYIKGSSHRICTRIYDCLKPYRSMAVNELLYNLNEFSLTIWLLDDGHRNRSCWSIALARFTDAEKKYAMEILKKKFNIDSYIGNSDSRYLWFDAVNSRELDDMVFSNIPNQLDIVEYKITNTRCEPLRSLYININGESVKFHEYCKDKNLDYKKTYREERSNLLLT